MREKLVFDNAMIKPRGKGLQVLVLGKYIDEYFSLFQQTNWQM